MTGRFGEFLKEKEMLLSLKEISMDIQDSVFSDV